MKIFQEERFKTLRERLLQEVDQDIKDRYIRNIDKLQLLITIVCLSLFPFVARGFIEEILSQDQINFDDFIEQRKTELPEFVINAVSIK